MYMQWYMCLCFLLAAFCLLLLLEQYIACSTDNYICLIYKETISLRIVVLKFKHKSACLRITHTLVVAQ